MGKISDKPVHPTTNARTPFTSWLTFLYVLAIIAAIYAVTYGFSGILIYIPAFFMWVIWLAVVIVGTAVTIGVAWLLPGWCSFINSFINFNIGIGDSAGPVGTVLYNLLPYIGSICGVIVLSFLILSIIEVIKYKEANKNKLIWAIVLTLIFIAAMIFNVNMFISSR